MLRPVALLGLVALGVYLALEGARGDAQVGAVGISPAAHLQAQPDDRPQLEGLAHVPSAPESPVRVRAAPPTVAEEEAQVVDSSEEDFLAWQQAGRAWEEHLLEIAKGEDPTQPAWRLPRAAGSEGRRGRIREDEVLQALRWLAAHQSLDGRFAAAEFVRWCEGHDNAQDRLDGMGRAEHDVGATAMAVCSFLGAGYTNRGNHEFRWVVLRGLRWLRERQDGEGVVRTRAPRSPSSRPMA